MLGSVGEKIAGMQRALREHAADVGELAQAQAALRERLSAVGRDLPELVAEEANARDAAARAREEVDSAHGELCASEVGVLSSLQRPVPFMRRPPSLSEGEAACAIASTLRGIARAEVSTWLFHHLGRCGFARAFLFFDNPCELTLHAEALSTWHGRAVPVQVDDKLQSMYASCRLFSTLSDALQQDWLARQQLHVEIAMGWAEADGCAWLLHIDLDELFIVRGCTAPQHFGAVHSDTHSTQYLNHEGVPEAPAESPGLLRENRFAAVTLFRRNPVCLFGGIGVGATHLWQQYLDSLATLPSSPEQPAMESAIAFWARRSRAVFGRSQFFLAYANGKGATRLGTACLPNGVHRFGAASRHFWCPDEAFVLHYAHGCCEAVAEKLCRLRSSSGTWWRSFALNACGRSMSDRAVRETYEQVVALTDAKEAKEQVASGVCFRFTLAKQQAPVVDLNELD